MMARGFLALRRRFYKLVAQRRLAAYERRGLTVGQNFYCTAGLHITSPSLVTIGNDVSISADVQFIAHDAALWHLDRAGIVSGGTTQNRPITVHDGSGIGYGAIILPGVSIGPRSIVGAGSVVRRDVPPETVVAGNPARFVMTLADYVATLQRPGDEMPDEALALVAGATRA